MKASQSIADRLKSLWIRFAFRRGLRYSNDYERLNSAYFIGDPWNMASLGEQHRFAATNGLILETFGQVGSLLEIGCGEGHQSVYLRQICNRLTGLDVSIRAIERARRRCPNCTFLVGDIYSQELGGHKPFDVVVASEVLYYMSDVPSALKRIRSLGRNGLVTYFAGEMATLDPVVLPLPGVSSKVLQFKQCSWRLAWWRDYQD
jgi:SAM-dependent methyltransferase